MGDSLSNGRRDRGGASPAPRRRHPRAGTLGLVAAALLGACGDGAAHEPPPTVAALRAQVMADSLDADEAALATLPAPLQAVLRLEPYLTDRYIASTAGAECFVLGDSLPDVLVAERRRVRLRLPDSTAVVVFARADREGATLRRVEVVRRRPRGGEQLGFIWDGSDDVTTEVRWPLGVRGRTESARQPRGSPVPRAVRALGRRLFTLTCPAGVAPEEMAPDTALTDRARAPAAARSP
jgi:hypothetical protein